MFKVAEKFISINGEGSLAGQLAVFIRLKGCNLNCAYCDTAWANQNDEDHTIMNKNQIYQYIKGTGVKNVTLTGGEPLLNPDILELLQLLAVDDDLHVEIETNGSIDLAAFILMDNSPAFTMDYKLPGSLMESNMLVSNFEMLEKKDAVKFVAGSIEDLERAKEIIEKYQLVERCQVYISPVFGKINLEDIVAYMMKYKMNGVTLQMQFHKIIWDPDKRGV